MDEIFKAPSTNTYIVNTELPLYKTMARIKLIVKQIKKKLNLNFMTPPTKLIIDNSENIETTKEIQL